MSLGEIQPVSEGIYAYLQPDGSWYLNNTGFLVSRDGVISVDATSTERRTRAYLHAIATVTPKPVCTLVNTHHHGDHTHGNYLLSGATIVGHERCREAILGTPMPPPPGIWETRRPGRPRPGPGRHGGLQRRPPPHVSCLEGGRGRGWAGLGKRRDQHLAAGQAPRLPAQGPLIRPRSPVINGASGGLYA